MLLAARLPPLRLGHTQFNVFHTTRVMSPLGKRQKIDRTLMPSPCCLPLTSPDTECTQSTACGRILSPSPHLMLTDNHRSRHLVPKATKPLLFIPQCLKPNRPTKPPATSIHRCLLISEILSLILEFVCQFDQSPESELKWDRTSGKRTLASLARTCRTLSVPALDALWMRLDNLDPLIKVLPRRMWAKKHYPFVVRLFDQLCMFITRLFSTDPDVYG